MKNRIFIVAGLFLWFLMLCSCLNSKREQQSENEKCIPAFVLIVSLAKENKPKYPLIIRTDKNDTSYLKLIGSDRENLEKNGFTASKEYYRLSTITPVSYFTFKSYIVAHNTHKNRTVFNADDNTMKIMLFDKCDTLSYAVDKKDTGYFSKMIDTLNLQPDDELRGYIHYYHEIQQWDGNR